jgi:hypothetical protein
MPNKTVTAQTWHNILRLRRIATARWCVGISPCLNGRANQQQRPLRAHELKLHGPPRNLTSSFSDDATSTVQNPTK